MLVVKVPLIEFVGATEFVVVAELTDAVVELTPYVVRMELDVEVEVLDVLELTDKVELVE